MRRRRNRPSAPAEPEPEKQYVVVWHDPAMITKGHDWLAFGPFNLEDAEAQLAYAKDNFNAPTAENHLMLLWPPHTKWVVL